jgi:hypothetical protein
MQSTNTLHNNNNSLGSFEKKNKKKALPLNIVSCQISFSHGIESTTVKPNVLSAAFTEANNLKIDYPFSCSPKAVTGHFLVLTFCNLPNFDVSLLIHALGSLLFKLNIHQFLCYRYPIADSEFFNYKVYFSFSDKFTIDNPSMFVFRGFVPTFTIFATEAHALVYSLQDPLSNEVISSSSIEVISSSFCSNIKLFDLQSLISHKT